MDDITKWLRTFPGVVLVDVTGKVNKVTNGIDTGRPAILVGVVRKLPVSALKAEDVIPKLVNDKETDIIETGIIRALEDFDRKGRWRPVPGGVSIAHYKVTSGSGWWAKRNGVWVLCTNNHVGANENECLIGDAWLQPGPAYGGGAVDEIVKLLGFVHLIGFDEPPPEPPPEPPSDCPVAGSIVTGCNWFAEKLGRKTRLPHAVVPHNIEDVAHFLAALSKYRATNNGINVMDGAIGLPNDEALIVDPTILGIGIVDKFIEAEVDMEVKKSGTNSGLTYGEVRSIDSTVTIQHRRGVLPFEHMGVTKKSICIGGDSGSLVVTNEQNAKGVGVISAGSDTLSIFNHYRYFKEAFQLD